MKWEFSFLFHLSEESCQLFDSWVRKMTKEIVRNAIRAGSLVGEASHEFLKEAGVDGLDLLSVSLGNSLQLLKASYLQRFLKRDPDVSPLFCSGLDAGGGRQILEGPLRSMIFLPQATKESP